MRIIRYIASSVALSAVLVVGAGFYAASSSLGRCHQPPEGKSLSDYQRRLAVKNPGKVAWIQSTQAARFVWESGTGPVPCPEGQYAVVLFTVSNQTN
ncbi:hypothetical protein A2419_00185 [Candidatus Adlerbacteria bacterium RIFOXYC1_FULL_48_26]|uniref:Uncharacterized protein n=1 Tax=Candidatus Adlerbacteria bacterium RIFOXYC1_FULL_48_26 TaxID=1797247 RepID=A0A1F4Y264_9BACT|nr:MAG: hypothetical protein A2419_00185 [Candidatus Adlerbacteria bacterium RIFOXYC1_FULL_48_26]OGC94428.1 MAG: hypothetical protein A2389_02490 [Candidatus Adlerbacteria bacterium RIFOXYB1_FULL_48_10]